MRVVWDDRAAGRLVVAAYRGLLDAGEHVLEEANRTVPIEEATLTRSGQVTGDPAQLQVAVSYDTVYAVRQHEDTRLRHDPGRRAKWLELTVAERAQAVGAFLAQRVRAAAR